MIICNCNRLTEQELLDAIAAGVPDSMRAIEHCGGIPRCCGCLSRIDKMMKDAPKEEPSEELYHEVR